MNITWRLICPHSWVSSNIGPVSLTAHRSTVYIQNSFPSRGSQFSGLRWETVLNPLSSCPGPRPEWQIHWRMVTSYPGVPDLVWSSCKWRHLPRVTSDHRLSLAAHLSLAQLLSPHSAFLKYSGILKLSEVNPALDWWVFLILHCNIFVWRHIEKHRTT